MEPITLGVCALDRKARSKPMQNILNRILANRDLDVSIVNFGDKVILDEPADSWPVVDVLISFFSSGFPLDKAISYVELRKPVCVNDLALQKILWDRRAVLAILDAAQVPTPFRIEVDRDGGPGIEPSIGLDLKKRLGVDLLSKRPIKDCYLKDEDTLVVGDQEIRKPYVEKPVSGEDHNIHIYFPRSMGGGGRRLFRKVGNKSSEFDPNLMEPRKEGSYIYEEFVSVDNAEDVKVYTIGPYFVHAETRKSPVVDGLVKRNPDGKEIRYITKLSEAEVKMATSISKALKQNICGFDLLRVGDKSYVIDVNGWSFVKGNDYYYDKCAEILSKFCKANTPRRSLSASGASTPRTDREQGQSSWNLKATVTVFRHGDRTPKQKLKRSFKAKDSWTAPLIELLQGRKEEIILRQQLDLVSTAAAKARDLKGDGVEDLDLVIDVIQRKKDMPGTKVQMKPAFKEGQLDKMTLIVKWGGEFSHAARHQARDYGQNMRRDMMIMCPKALKNCTIYTSSERRVTASAEIFAGAFLDDPEDPDQNPHQLVIRKDLLDDSNAAKDDMDAVKKKLKASLKIDGPDSEVRPDNWPEDMAPPAQLAREIGSILGELSKVMAANFQRLDVDKLQTRWCTHETPKLFRERWDKLFADYEEEPNDPSRTSELADMLSHDGLHNRAFLQAIFSDPSAPDGEHLAKLGELYRRSCALFQYVCPREYGIEPQEKERIGLLTSMPLMRNIIADLERAEEGSLCSLYFTKESHIHTLLNLILASDLPVIMPTMPPLDYFSSITFEVFEKTAQPPSTAPPSAAHSPAPSVGGHEAAPALAPQPRGSTNSPSPPPSAAASRGNSPPSTRAERSLLITVSEGAHSSCILSIDLDARHSIHPLPRRPLTQHIELAEAVRRLSAHSLSLTREVDELMLARGQIEGAAVFFGEKEAESEHGLLPVAVGREGRRGSTETDRGSVTA
ncbi:putative VIP1-actin cytoskeleton organization and biogenesis-related protein [Jaminaea rosea]|uniref:Inositol hexakisphosphate and diphosphoinositol-pentakisphosphate kinase n=1 Tax=Jaminaea rosea TaxID=1569628 RepID=A0A316UTE8_9BASI|nr:putative VIP1-actin cytoskeleton organization and biogenesis-related protein [Jaminaea rosea]PWN28532.1 putative VIP1-actin cytoskeleton organization and biogenesis-related protein [Jaminaea rosea]